MPRKIGAHQRSAAEALTLPLPERPFSTGSLKSEYLESTQGILLPETGPEQAGMESLFAGQSASGAKPKNGPALVDDGVLPYGLRSLGTRPGQQVAAAVSHSAALSRLTGRERRHDND